MKRRRFIQSLAAVPVVAVPEVIAQQPAASQSARPTEEAAKLQLTPLDGAGEPTPRFFSELELKTLRRLSEIIMPPLNEMPGALEARAPEFLDFLIGASSTERKRLYTTGLNALNSQAGKRFGKPFADTTDAQAGELLAPLKQAWTYEPPADPLAQFLREAKQDVRNATLNSREYTTANATDGRRGGGLGQYWYPLD